MAFGQVEREGFLSYLSSTARPEDFVVVKVDIDTPAKAGLGAASPDVSLEKSIVNALATSPYAALVDEVYFEYHFNFGTYAGHSPWGDPECALPGVPCWWDNRANASSKYFADTVDDALALMRKLREAGIRSHFWV